MANELRAETLFFRIIEKMKKVNVYIEIKQKENGIKYIACICKRENKRCRKNCEKETMLYDEYKGWQNCFKNRDSEKYK